MSQAKGMKGKGDFFDFVMNAQKDQELSGKFFRTNMEALGLYNFFQANGYDVPMETCEKLINVRNSLVKGGMECDDLCDIVLEGRGY